MERYALNLKKRYFFTKIMLPYHRGEDSAYKNETLGDSHRIDCGGQGSGIISDEGIKADALRLENINSGDLLLTSEAEVRAAFDGYAAYYGSYSVDKGGGIIVHHVEAALMPNWVGTDQVRHFEFQGNCLTLQGPLVRRGVREVVSLVWERLP